MHAGMFRDRRSAFTFMEIILVVTIIGILAGIALPRLVNKAGIARVQATKAQMNSIKTALLQYEMNNDAFPTSSEGLQALVTKPSSAHENDWEKALDFVPRDAWGELFLYAYPASHGMDYDLTSKGRDRQEGTEDDINNWDVLNDPGR